MGIKNVIGLLMLGIPLVLTVVFIVLEMGILPLCIIFGAACIVAVYMMLAIVWAQD